MGLLCKRMGRRSKSGPARLWFGANQDRQDDRKGQYDRGGVPAWSVQQKRDEVKREEDEQDQGQECDDERSGECLLYRCVRTTGEAPCRVAQIQGTYYMLQGLAERCSSCLPAVVARLCVRVRVCATAMQRRNGEMMKTDDER